MGGMGIGSPLGGMAGKPGGRPIGIPPGGIGIDIPPGGMGIIPGGMGPPGMMGAPGGMGMGNGMPGAGTTPAAFMRVTGQCSFQCPFWLQLWQV